MLRIIVNTLTNLLFVGITILYLIHDISKHSVGFTICEIALLIFMLFFIGADILLALTDRKVQRLTKTNETLYKGRN